MIIIWPGWDFLGYSWISGFRYHSESNKNVVEMHFGCDIWLCRIQTLTQSYPRVVKQDRNQNKGQKHGLCSVGSNNLLNIVSLHSCHQFLKQFFIRTLPYCSSSVHDALSQRHRNHCNVKQPECLWIMSTQCQQSTEFSLLNSGADVLQQSRSKICNRLSRTLFFDQSKQDRMHIFKVIFFFKP